MSSLEGSDIFINRNLMSTKRGNISLHGSPSEKSLEAYFEQVYRDYFERLFAYALIITKSDNLAQDVVSDVFFNLWSKKTDLFSIKELKSYLFTSVKNQAVRALSNDPVHFHSDSYDHAISSIDKLDPEELLVGKELDQFINDTINGLPPQCELVFRMVRERNLKYDEVAEELGISNETVKYHVKTALKKIKAALANHFTESRVVKWISTGSVALMVSEILLRL